MPFLSNTGINFPFGEGQVVAAHIYHVISSTDILPACFVSMKTEYDSINKFPSKAVTRISSSSSCPFFNETLYLSIPKQSYAYLNEQPVNSLNTIILTIADNGTKSILARFPLALKNLIPYRQINLQLSAAQIGSKQNTLILRLSLTLFDMMHCSLVSLGFPIYPLDTILFECQVESISIGNLVPSSSLTSGSSATLSSFDPKSLLNINMLCILKICLNIDDGIEDKLKSNYFQEKTLSMGSLDNNGSIIGLDFDANNKKTFVFDKSLIKAYLPKRPEDCLGNQAETMQSSDNTLVQEFSQMTDWCDGTIDEMPRWMQAFVLSFLRQEYNPSMGIIFELHTKGSLKENDAISHRLNYFGAAVLKFSDFVSGLATIKPIPDSYDYISPLNPPSISMKVPIKFNAGSSMLHEYYLNVSFLVSQDFMSLILQESPKVFDPFRSIFSQLGNVAETTELPLQVPGNTVDPHVNNKIDEGHLKALTKTHKEEIDKLKDIISTLEIRNGLLLRQVQERKDVLQQQLIDENVDTLSMEEMKQKYIRAAHQNRQHVLTTQQLEGKLRNYHELVIQKTEVEKKYLELQHRYRKIQRKMAVLEDKSREVETLRSHISHQESIMKQLQLMMATTGSIKTSPMAKLANNQSSETGKSDSEYTKRLDRLETMIQKLVNKDAMSQNVAHSDSEEEQDKISI